MNTVQRAYTSINPNAPAFVPQMPEAPQQSLQLPVGVQRTQSYQPQFTTPVKGFSNEPQGFGQCDNFQFSGKQFETTQHVMPKIESKPFTLDFNQFETSSGKTKSTKGSGSSQADNSDYASGMSDFEESISQETSPQQVSLKKTQSALPCCSHSHQQVEQPTQWKSKVRTELCKFWLAGLPCENREKEQGCGFAHGEHELQPKQGLNKQYLTSVCKNFLENPSSCTYGDRCIFMHPTMDPRKPQPIEAIVRENTKYTLMRLFQNIPGAECVYVNPYAKQTPRLPIFREVAPNRGKKNC